MLRKILKIFTSPRNSVRCKWQFEFWKFLQVPGTPFVASGNQNFEKNYKSPELQMLQVDMGIFGNFSKSPELQILQGAMPDVASGWCEFVYSIRCNWLIQMQWFAKSLSYECTLHSLHALVNYYYREKKQRLRKMGLCLCMGHTRGLVSSSFMMLPLTSRISGFRPEAFCHAQTGHLPTWIGKCNLGHLPLRTFAGRHLPNAKKRRNASFSDFNLIWRN